MVYVDDMRAPFGRMILCHMIADTSDELHAMAKLIGVKRKWCQGEDTWKEHYDVSLSRRKLAVDSGAKEISWREMGDRVRKVLEAERRAERKALGT